MKNNNYHYTVAKSHAKLCCKALLLESSLIFINLTGSENYDEEEMASYISFTLPKDIHPLFC